MLATSAAYLPGKYGSLDEPEEQALCLAYARTPRMLPTVLLTLLAPALAAPVGDGDDGPFSITRPPIFRRPALHVTHPGTLLLTRPFMPVNPLEELHRSMLLGMGAPDIFFGDEDEDEDDDPFEAMLNEAHGLFGLFGDPLVHRGLGRGIDLSRLPNGTLQIALRMHALDPASLRVRVDARARMCVITGTQTTEDGIGSFQRTFSLPSSAVRRALVMPSPRRMRAARMPSPHARLAPLVHLRLASSPVSLRRSSSRATRRRPTT